MFCTQKEVYVVNKCSVLSTRGTTRTKGNAISRIVRCRSEVENGAMRCGAAGRPAVISLRMRNNVNGGIYYTGNIKVGGISSSSLMRECM